MVFASGGGSCGGGGGTIVNGGTPPGGTAGSAAGAGPGGSAPDRVDSAADWAGDVRDRIGSAAWACPPESASAQHSPSNANAGKASLFRMCK